MRAVRRVLVLVPPRRRGRHVRRSADVAPASPHRSWDRAPSRPPEVWPRVDGLRALEFGTPGALRAELNALVLAGRKTATDGLLSGYDQEGEELEHVGARLALLDGEQTRVVCLRFRLG